MNITTSVSQSIISKFQQGLKALAPEMVNEVINKGWQDERIAKLVSGFFLTLAGLNLVAKGGLFKNVQIKMAHIIHPNADRGNGEQKIHWGAVSLGLVVSVYGVYNLISGLFESKQAREPVKFNPESQCPSTPDLDTRSKDHESIYNAKKQIDACPAAKKLWNIVDQNGGVTIFHTNAEEAHFGAFCDPKNQEIYLAPQSLRMMTKDLLFELNNLKQSFTLNFLDDNTCFLTAENYALRKERIEYDSALATYKITKKCIDSGAWPADSYLYYGFKSGLWSNFDGYLHTQKEQKHFETYVEEWYDLCKKNN